MEICSFFGGILMKFLEWKIESIGNYDTFMIANKNEAERFVHHFNTALALSCSFPSASGEEEYYYFLNTIEKTITPMPFLALAFGGMYNGCPPYGEEIKVPDFVLADYKLTFNKHDKRNKDEL